MGDRGERRRGGTVSVAFAAFVAFVAFVASVVRRGDGRAARVALDVLPVQLTLTKSVTIFESCSPDTPDP